MIQLLYSKLTHVIKWLVMKGFNLAVLADKEKAEEDNDGHREKNCTVENVLMWSESPNQLKYGEKVGLTL